MTSHEGGCLCGKVRFRVTAEALDSGYCHCRMCQRNSGAPVVAWVTFPRTGFAWIAGKAAEYPSSAHAKRLFCGAICFGAVPSRMIDFMKRSPKFCEIMQDLFAGTQPYLELKTRLLRNVNTTVHEILMSFLFRKLILGETRV